MSADGSRRTPAAATRSIFRGGGAAPKSVDSASTRPRNIRVAPPRRGRDPPSTTALPPARDRAASPSTDDTRSRRRTKGTHSQRFFRAVADGGERRPPRGERLPDLGALFRGRELAQDDDGRALGGGVALGHLRQLAQQEQRPIRPAQYLRRARARRGARGRPSRVSRARSPVAVRLPPRRRDPVAARLPPRRGPRRRRRVPGRDRSAS